MNDLKNEITQLCSEIFEISDIKCDESFFDLGIDSMAVAKFVTEIKEKYTDKIDITDIYEYDTIDLITGYIGELIGAK